jgi:hypothetical protein
VSKAILAKRRQQRLLHLIAPQSRANFAVTIIIISTIVIAIVIINTYILSIIHHDGSIYYPLIGSGREVQVP